MFSYNGLYLIKSIQSCKTSKRDIGHDVIHLFRGESRDSAIDFKRQGADGNLNY